MGNNNDTTVDKHLERKKLIQGTFGTELGKRLIGLWKEAIVDRAVYVPGLSHDEVAYREGQRNVIMQIMKEIDYE